MSSFVYNFYFVWNEKYIAISEETCLSTELLMIPRITNDINIEQKAPSENKFLKNATVIFQNCNLSINNMKEHW